MDKHVPFPQADDIEKIYSIINILNESDLSDFDEMKECLGNVSIRQVSYYLSAACYFGIIETKDRKKGFTEFGRKLRSMNSSMQKAEFITAILGDPVFRKTFIYQKLYGERTVEDIAMLIKEYHPECNDRVCHRRAQTVISWIRWIEQTID